MKITFLETRNTIRAREALSVVEDSERGHPGLVCFHGEPSVGKTMFSIHYTGHTGAIYLRVLQNWTPRAMLAALCRETKATEYNSVEKCKLSLCKELERRQEKNGDEGSTTIFIDEADRLSVDLVEHCRDIHDLTQAPVIFVGEPSLLPILKSKSRLWDRVQQVVKFEPIQTEDVSLFALKTCDLKLVPEAAQAVARMTEGKFRRIRNELLRIEQMARASDTKQVSLAMVEALNGGRVSGVGGRKMGNGKQMTEDGGKHGNS
jgi:hypothetical protein